MTDTINKIRLEMDKEEIRTSIAIAKGTTLGRTIYFTLLHGGTVYSIPDGSIATFAATKPDGKDVYNDCAIVGDEVVYSVSNQLIAVAGDVRCQIIITTPDQTRIPSPTFILKVYEKIFDESVLESTNDYSALQTYCIRAQEAAQKAEGIVSTTKATMKAVSEECAARTEDLTKKVAAVTLVEEVTSNKITLEKEKNIVLVTNINGLSEYASIPFPDNPCDALSLADEGSLRLIMSDSPQFEWIDDEVEISGFNSPLRSVINYHDELCYLNTEMYVKRRIKAATLSSDREWKEVNLFEGTSFEGSLHAYATPIEDAIKNPKGIWYTTSHFRYELTQLNDVPQYGVAYQMIPGYVVLVMDKEYELFLDWLGVRDVKVLYAVDEPTIDNVLDFNGILRYSTLNDLYLAVDTFNVSGTEYGYAQITVQKPTSQFANAVMELL